MRATTARIAGCGFTGDELDQVTGGAGGKGLLAHELTHTVQQSGAGLTILASSSTSNIDGAKAAPDGEVKGVIKSGGGSDV